jgi:8-oxo-dGTP pyrophosphatase MutT (NUDIX family)/broad specificity phosphatase PhoE
VTDSGLPPVLAAGALCWRVVDGKVRILLVYRTQHKDVSLPKGKVDPGETLPETAVREISEETGLVVGLDAPLGQVEYQIANGREKIVYYWSAEVDEQAIENSTFTPNDEVESLEWVSIKKARKRLTYPHDVELLEVFEERLQAGRARTFAIIVVRHGKAVPPEAWDGPDSTRPLLERGTEQAASIALGLAAYRPVHIITSTAARCIATISPLSRLIAIEPTESDVISQDSYESGERVESDLVNLIAKRVRKTRSVVLCSHGPVIPDIIREIAGLTNTPPTNDFLSMGNLSTGEFSVLHISTEHPRSGIVALETHSPVA